MTSDSDKAKARELLESIEVSDIEDIDTRRIVTERVASALSAARREERERCAECLEKLVDATRHNIEPQALWAFRIAIDTIRAIGTAKPSPLPGAADG
jgi:hypothetical protein